MANNYNVIHCHSQYSLLDSATKYTEYVDKCVQLGQKAIAFTEHGNIYNWISKKRYCEANHVKYIHGCEVYLTEALEPAVKDNYHTILLAKNYEGVKELNSLISTANKEDHFYYKPRITFDEFLGISDNIISTSACMASPLNKLPEDNPYYEKLCRKYTYYEIQPHYHLEQMAFNKKLMLLHLKYGTPLIVGTDTHSIDEYRGECRKILQKAKKIEYADEDAFDLTYKSYDELRAMFQKQHSLAMEIIDEALENTLKLADMCEEWDLDVSFKYPRMSDNDIETFDKKVDFMFKEKIATGVIPESQKEAFIKAIEEEKAVFKKLDMCSFMLFMSELMMWCNDNGVVHGFARGSVAGSRIAYILDIIDINPEQWHTVFSRFCNEDRMEIGDIDSDFPDEQRGLVYDYIIKRFGENNAMYILALGTLKDKSTIDEIGRALGYELTLVDTIKKEYEEEYATDPSTPVVREKYSELFYYFDGLLDCTVSQSIHPAGIVASPITLSDNYGCFINSKDGKVTLQIDMEDVHESGLVKYDILGLNTVQIIADTCKLAGIPYPKSHEIDWNDQAVWQDMQKFPTGIFQMESSFAFRALKQFNPTSIFDMSLITASIRPSGASYRDQLLARHEHKNPSPLIDNLLKDNLGYLIYQEDVIAFLQQICGMTGSEADNLRRAIARKQTDRLERALPQVLDGYCSKSDQPREVAEEEAKEFIQVIQDASSYMFGYNHSIAYCMLGYLCAYLRYYYPYEFVASYFNNIKTQEDISNCKQLTSTLGITIKEPRFRHAKFEYFIDRAERSVYKGLKGVKFLNSSVSDELYAIKDEFYGNFMQLLSKMTLTSLKSNQRQILINLDFFEEFGNSQLLNAILEAFIFLKEGTAKQVRKNTTCNPVWLEIIKRYSTETATLYKITDIEGAMNEIERYIRAQNIPEYSFKQKFQWQMEYLGYIAECSHSDDLEERKKLVILDYKIMHAKKAFPGRPKGSPWGYVVKTKSLGSGKESEFTIYADVYEKQPILKYSIIKVKHFFQKGDYWYIGSYDILE